MDLSPVPLVAMSHAPPPPPPQVSPDGKFFFNGTEWVPFVQQAATPTAVASSVEEIGAGVANGLFRYLFIAVAIVGIPLLLLMLPVIVRMLFDPDTAFVALLTLAGLGVVGWRIWLIIRASSRT